MRIIVRQTIILGCDILQLNLNDLLRKWCKAESADGDDCANGSQVPLDTGKQQNRSPRPAARLVKDLKVRELMRSILEMDPLELPDKLAHAVHQCRGAKSRQGRDGCSKSDGCRPVGEWFVFHFDEDADDSS
jgi:hypothetical protein